MRKETAWRIKNLRLGLGLTQEQMAAKIGVTFSTVSRWENGRGNPSPLALQRLEELCRLQRQDKTTPKATSKGDT